MASVWDNEDYVRRWNETYGLDMRGAPIRTQFIFPFLKERWGDLSGKNLLDLGCGNGNLIRYFSDAAFAGWTGVDAGSAVLASARDANPDERLTFIRADATRPIQDIPANSFDIASSVFVLEEIADAGLRGYMGNFSAALNPQGEAHVFTQHPAHLLLEAAKAAAAGTPNPKYLGSQGYYDREPCEYAFAVWTGADGQPERVPYHHHTLADIMNAVSASGLVVKNMLEIPGSAVSGGDYVQPPPHDLPRFLYLNIGRR